MAEYFANRFRLLLPEKTIWLYTGFYWEEIFKPIFTKQSQDWINNYLKQCETRKQIISQCNVLVDGRYVDSLSDISLKWVGSKNQRVIDAQESINKNRLILYE